MRDLQKIHGKYVMEGYAQIYKLLCMKRNLSSSTQFPTDFVRYPCTKSVESKTLKDKLYATLQKREGKEKDAG